MATWCSCRAFALLHHGNAAKGVFKVLLKLSPGDPFHHETVRIKNVFLTSNYFSAVIFFFLIILCVCVCVCVSLGMASRILVPQPGIKPVPPCSGIEDS